MRKIDYVCDLCGRVYHCDIQAWENDRSILAKVLITSRSGYEICRQCLKQLGQAAAAIKTHYTNTKEKV